MKDKEILYRVNIVSLDIDEKKYKCRLIDIGCIDWFPINNLYICRDKFKNLPAQAIKISLKNLKDFADYSCTLEILRNNLVGKSFVGEILTDKQNYNNLIETVLYDTTGKIDVNVNNLIEDTICYSTPKPTLESNLLNEVIISQINDNGNIFCWTRNNGLNHIQKLISNLLKSKNKVSINETNLYDLSKLDLLYLVLSPHQNSWYRAIIKGPGSSSDEYLMFCVDYGMNLNIKKKDMWRLDKYSVALSRYPYQAIEIQLFDVLVVTEDVVDKMKNLICPGMKTFVSNLDRYLYKNLF